METVAKTSFHSVPHVSSPELHHQVSKTHSGCEQSAFWEATEGRVLWWKLLLICRKSQGTCPFLKSIHWWIADSHVVCSFTSVNSCLFWLRVLSKADAPGEVLRKLVNAWMGVFPANRTCFLVFCPCVCYRTTSWMSSRNYCGAFLSSVNLLDCKRLLFADASQSHSLGRFVAKHTCWKNENHFKAGSRKSLKSQNSEMHLRKTNSENSFFHMKAQLSNIFRSFLDLDQESVLCTGGKGYKAATGTSQLREAVTSSVYCRSALGVEHRINVELQPEVQLYHSIFLEVGSIHKFMSPWVDVKKKTRTATGQKRKRYNRHFRSVNLSRFWIRILFPLTQLCVKRQPHVTTVTEEFYVWIKVCSLVPTPALHMLSLFGCLCLECEASRHVQNFFFFAPKRTDTKMARVCEFLFWSNLHAVSLFWDNLRMAWTWPW